MQTLVYKNRLDIYFSILLILFPIIDVYKFSIIRLGYAGMLVGLLFFLVYLKNTNKAKFPPQPLCLFFLFMIVIPGFFSVMTTSYTVHFIQYGTLLFFTFILLFCSCIKLEMILKSYKIVVLITTVFFLFQESVFFVSGYRISGIIPFLDFIYYSDLNTNDMIEIHEHANRSSSLFFEPAMFAQYLIPYFIINMEYTKKALLKLCYISFILVLLRSGVGLVMCGLCWGIYLINMPIKKRIVKYFILITFIFVLLGIGSVVVISEYGQSMISRSAEFDSTEADASGFVRVIRGFYLYEDLDILQKIFGVGTNNLTSVIEKSGVSSLFANNDRYLNGVQAILVGGGLVGFSLFLLALYKIGQYGNFQCKTLLFAFFLLSFLAATYLSNQMLLFLIIAIGYKQNRTPYAV